MALRLPSLCADTALSIQWLWFALAQFSTSGENLYSFASSRRNVKVIMVLLKYHYWISFSFYSLVFVVTVLSFKKGQSYANSMSSLCGLV